MQLLEALLKSLVGVKGFDKKSFEAVHASGMQVTSARMNPLKPLRPEYVWPPARGITQISLAPVAVVPDESETDGIHIDGHVPWSNTGFFLSSRPPFTFDPLFHAGCYYVQEASGMFLEQALKQSIDLSQRLRILDLCAAPGGKSTHIQSLITEDSLLVSNELIKSRASILEDNIIKWGSDNVMVTNNDPRDFSALHSFFDVIVIDAPCSGSGLFRRDEQAMDEWSINNVALCSQRQEKILADVWPALKENGVLIYATCSYSKKEDEDITDWIMEHLPVTSCQLDIEQEWGIIETIADKSNAFGYRFWPDRLKGEGFFLSCFKKVEAAENVDFRTKNKLSLASKKEVLIIKEWVKDDRHEFIQKNNLVYAIPKLLLDDVRIVLGLLHVLYSGIIVGELFHDSLVPAHSLAMSRFVHENIPVTDNVDYESAINYLKRKEIALNSKIKGWTLINYQNHKLGWIKVLANRINNYYPKELRILKDV